MFSGRKLLFALTVLVSVNICYGFFDFSADGEALYKRVFYETDKEPMSPSETFAALENLKTMTKDDYVLRTIDNFEVAYKGQWNKCNSETFKELGLLFRSYQFGNEKEGKSITSIATMVQSKIDALSKICNDEYETKRAKAMNSWGASKAEKSVDELLDSVDGDDIILIPRIGFQKDNKDRLHHKLVAYVQKKGSTTSRTLFGTVFNPEKFRTAYQKTIIEPCKGFMDKFGETIELGLALGDYLQPDKQERDQRLLKKQRICHYTKSVMTVEDCLSILNDQ